MNEIIRRLRALSAISAKLQSPILSPSIHLASATQSPSQPSADHSLISVISTLAARFPLNISESSDRVILTSEDGSSFFTSRALLAAHSTVFADASQVSSASGAAADTGSIPIGSSTAAGLTLLLAVISILGASPLQSHSNPRFDLLSSTVHEYQTNLCCADIVAIAEAMASAKMFQFSSFDRLFVRNVLSQLGNLGAAPGFTLSAVLGHHAYGHTAVYAKEMFFRGFALVPPSFTAVVHRFAPEHIARYARFYDAYNHAYFALPGLLASGEPMPDGENKDFAKHCRGKEKSRFNDKNRKMGYKHYRPACRAWRTMKDWGSMRNKAAVALFAKIGKDGKGPIDYNSIFLVLTKVVPCEKCAARLARTFEGPVKRFRATAGKY